MRSFDVLRGCERWDQGRGHLRHKHRVVVGLAFCGGQFVGQLRRRSNEATLSLRSWAFDGTVESIGVTHDSRLGSVPSATFSVNRWYKGGNDEKVTVQYEVGSISEFVPATGPGTRMLLAGEPRWGGQPLDDPVAWGCGFSLPWTDTAERAWVKSFAAGAAVNGSDATVPMLATDEVLRPGEPRRFDLSIHCGARVLSWKFNDRWWKTDEAGPEPDWVPAGWPSPTTNSGVIVTVELSADESTLSVRYADTTVQYHAGDLLSADLCA
jgi:hypothetical protein